MSEQDSLPSILASAKLRHERLRKQLMAAEFNQHSLTMNEKLLKDCIKSRDHYIEATNRLEKQVEQNRKALTFAVKYIAEHQEDRKNAKDADEIARKIAAMYKKIDSLTKKLLEEQK